MNWYLVLFIGYITGVICVLIGNALKKPDGIFTIDLYDPMNESLELQLLKPLGYVLNKNYIRFKVVVIDDKSREKHRL